MNEFELFPYAKDLINLLGDSPTELKKNNITKIKSLFPIPREQDIFWADVELDLRPSGVVCTNKGVFIKSKVNAIPKKVKNSNGKKEKEKAQLYYFKWEDFEPEWFTNDAIEENKALIVDAKHSEKFINSCKTLSTQTSNFDYCEYNLLDEKTIENLLAQIIPVDVAALQSSQSAVFVEQKSSLNTPSGHGEMAEEAINLIDKVLGFDAVVVGRDNAKDGADRIVNGILVQTKYYNTATGSCEACFSSETGLYRYMSDGKPMQLEVPKDQYEAVIKKFEIKIKENKVPGVTDPKDAKKIVRKGRLTYKQAVNITKPGKIESLKYDAATGAVMCSCAFGITFVATVFLTWQRTGNIKEAIKTGVSAGIQVFGISFVQHMVISQIARTGLASTLLAPSQQIVQRLGSQSSSTIVNGIRALSGKSAIYGAAASKHLAKILRSNAITSAITFAIFSIPETYKVASQKISIAQYTKNMSVLLGSILGGTGGAVAAGVVAAKVAGAAGTAIAPGVGTAIGIAGGFLGGAISAKAVDVIGDIFHEDDTEIITRFFNVIVSCLIGEYLLDSTEMDKIIKKLDSISKKEFKTLFNSLLKSENQEELIRNFLSPHFNAVIEEREYFTLPSNETILESMLEDCVDET